MSEPKEHYRGTFIPVGLMRLYEAGKINAEEVMLFAKIDALQDEGRNGCWASNQYLANWWGKTPIWVSSTISKLIKLNLIRSNEGIGPARRLKTNPQIGNSVLKKSLRPLEQNFKMVLKKTLTKVPYGKRENETASGHRESSFDLKGPDCPNQPPDLSPAVRSYAKFTQLRKFHIRSRLPKLVYAKGGQKGGWARQTLIQWQRRYLELADMFGEEKVNRVMRFFLHHYDHEFAPDARTLPAFAEKWDRIEKWHRRQLKERGEDPAEMESEETITEEKPVRRTMSEAEAKKYFAEVDQFDPEEDEE